MSDSTPLRILMLHNRYLIPAGEDVSADVQAELLNAAGHSVRLVEESNTRVAQLGLARTAVRSVWSKEAHSLVGELLRNDDFDVVHVKNWFPLLSPSVVYAAADHGVPVINSLNNFRLLCPEGMLHRDGAVCTDCVGKRLAWPGVWHRCYRNSVAGSLTVATMAAGHNAAGTWRRKVFRHVTPSHAARSFYLGAGWEGNSISVIPNFVYPDPGRGRGAGGYALFLGRLDVVKGIDTLLSAWQDHGIEYPLKVAGAGPLEGRIRAAAASNDRLEYLGQVNQAAAGELLGDASFVVVPTLGIETFGRVAVEALAKGTPAVVANHGGMRETVADGATGLVFTPGDAADLAAKVKILISDPSKLRALRPACREAYLSRYTGERVLDEWVGLYREAATRG